MPRQAPNSSGENGSGSGGPSSSGRFPGSAAELLDIGADIAQGVDYPTAADRGEADAGLRFWP